MPKENILSKIFTDKDIAEKVRNKLPKLFAIAELEASRAGKIGMEVGSIREQILVALLVAVYGEESVDTDIPITEPEIDVKVRGEPLSIKTITGLAGVKASWTVDATKAREFVKSYTPACDIILAIISWNSKSDKVQSGLFLIRKETQQKILKKMGRENYLKLPKEATNPRGVEISKDAIIEMLNDKDTLRIDIDWKKEDVDYKPYKRWVEFWNED